MPYLRTLSSFRDSVRGLAMGKGDTALRDILSLCDKLRDCDLVPLGVALDDQEGKSSTFNVPHVESSVTLLDRWQSPNKAGFSDGVN
jgi:cysteinyl-tRNA synthetase